jgi:hypothetical protein
VNESDVAPAPAAAAHAAVRMLLPALALALFAGPCLPGAVSAVGSDQQPVAIPQAPAAITGACDPGPWAAIAALPAPFSRKASGSLKLGWREDGLYGLLQASDAAISASGDAPWSRDCLELWLETDCLRSYDMSDHAFQIVLAPNPDAGPGKAIVFPASGHIARENIKAQWKPVAGGYCLGFFLPAAQLGLTMTSGTKVGMNYSVDDKGVATEEFYNDKDMEDGFRSPCRWGTIVLK